MALMKLALVQPERLEQDPAARDAHLLQLVDEAGERGADLALLPEDLLAREGALPGETAQPIPGPFFQALAERAARHRMWVCGCFYERDGADVWNTAFLIDRTGSLAGRYRKVHEAEVVRTEYGVRVGQDYPVFDTEFGRIGIMVCFDNIFPETARILALNGAELILFPDANYHPSELDIDVLARARAIDNAVYIVRSSYAVPVYSPGHWIGRSFVVGPDGVIRCDAGRAPGVLLAEVDPTVRRHVRGYGTWGVNAVHQRIRIERRPETYGRLLER